MASLTKKQPIDLKALSQINLNLDISQSDLKSMSASLSKRKDILINAVLIMLTLGITQHLFKANSIKMVTTKTELTQLEEKQKTAVSLEAEEKKLAAIQKTIPPGFSVETEIIKKVIEIAASKKVNVTFYAPTTPRNEKYYLVQSVDFTFESSYRNMIALMHALETNKENLYISSWKKNDEDVYRPVDKKERTPQSDETLYWEVSVSSTTLKNEK